MKCSAEALIDYKVRTCTKPRGHVNQSGNRQHHGDGFIWHQMGERKRSTPCTIPGCDCGAKVAESA